MMMTCGHCLRTFGLLHFGNGPGLCCECVHVHRTWLALERCGIEQQNKYAQEWLAQHSGGVWCKGARPDLDFANTYAERSGVTVEWLREHGREARPCNCGESDCEGWQMAHIDGDEIGRQKWLT